MQSIRTCAAASVLASAAIAGAYAQMPMKDSMKIGDMKMMSESSPMADGEVRKVDKDAGKITLKHGPIKADKVEMEPMTMVFHVKDKAMLDAVKAGDKVKFRVRDEGGQMTVTEIKPAS